MSHPKVLLINCPNRLTREPEFFPYGLSLLSRVLKNKKIGVKIYDLNLYRNIERFFEFLGKTSNEWGIIALSGIITTYSIQRQLAEKIFMLVPKALIISGGGLASSVPELLLNETKIEVACIGEGEDTILDLVQAWFGSGDISQVKGVYWKDRKTNEIVKNISRPPISNLDKIPYPDWDGANFDIYLERYSSFYNKGIKARKLNRRGDITTTRGCPFECSFCANIFQRHAVRARSVDNVIEEIKILKKKYNIDSIDFLDEHFCYSRKRVIEFCEKILQEKLNISWGTATRVDHIDKALLQFMKEAGCIFILFGFESGSQKILDNMNKKISVQLSLEIFKLVEETGIDALGNLIIGHPGESRETIIESRNFQKNRYQIILRLYSNRLHTSQVRVDLYRRFKTVSFIVPFPGTQLYKTFKAKIGDLETFLKKISLNDASQLAVNLSGIPTVELLGYQQILSNPQYWDMI